MDAHVRYFTPHVECFYPSPSDEHVAVPASRPHKFIRDRSDPKTPRAALAYPRLQRAQQPPQQPPQRPNLKARTRSRQKRNVWVHRKTLLCSPEKRIFRYHTTQINTITGVQKNEIVVKYQRLPVNGQRWFRRAVNEAQIGDLGCSASRRPTRVLYTGFGPAHVD